jgi:hypothetical protein
MVSKWSYNLISLYVVSLLLGIIHLSSCAGQSPAQNQSKARPVSYKILKDEMGAKISIGVEPEINEQQLRSTLVKAAADHQDDAARDYLVSDRLWVYAYLVLGERQSTIPAGTLRRYVPPTNPDAKEDDFLTRSMGKDDKFCIKLGEARKTLQ